MNTTETMTEETIEEFTEQREIPFEVALEVVKREYAKAHEAALSRGYTRTHIMFSGVNASDFYFSIYTEETESGSGKLLGDALRDLPNKPSEEARKAQKIASLRAELQALGAQ